MGLRSSVYFRTNRAVNQRRSRKTKREQQPGYTPPPRLPPRRKELPPPNIFFVALVAIIGAFGLICLYGVAYTLHDIWMIAAKKELVRTLPDVRGVAPGETAILDGHVAASEPARYKEFVAYIRERERGGGPRSVSWIEVVDQATPPIEVDVGSRVYKITNDTYSFDRLLWNWTDAERVDEGSTTFRNVITVQGIVVGSPVMAIGRLVPSAGGAVGFHAESIVGLSRAEYADRLERHQLYNWNFAGILALLGPLLIYLCAQGVRRIMGR